MKTYYSELSRKQIIVTWQDGATTNRSHYPRTERGHQHANAKMARLAADGYTATDAPRDWWATLLDEVRQGKEAKG